MKMLTLKYKKHEVHLSSPDNFEINRMEDIAKKQLYLKVGEDIVREKYEKGITIGIDSVSDLPHTQ